MDRKDFVIAFSEKTDSNKRVYCRSCDIIEYDHVDDLALSCDMMWCASKLWGIPYIAKSFNNTKHIPVITKKECRYLQCHEECNNCLISNRHNLKRI